MRYRIKETKQEVPMNRTFTQEEVKPSENTINIIKQIAYGYRTVKIPGTNVFICIN